MNKAYLEITIKVPAKDRVKAGEVYTKYKQPFLSTIPGAESKELLIREEDVQVLHGFDSRASAESYLKSALFGITAASMVVAACGRERPHGAVRRRCCC